MGFRVLMSWVPSSWWNVFTPFSSLNQWRCLGQCPALVQIYNGSSFCFCCGLTPCRRGGRTRWKLEPWLNPYFHLFQSFGIALLRALGAGCRRINNKLRKTLRWAAALLVVTLAFSDAAWEGLRHTITTQNEPVKMQKMNEWMFAESRCFLCVVATTYA